MKVLSQNVDLLMEKENTFKTLGIIYTWSEPHGCFKSDSEMQKSFIQPDKYHHFINRCFIEVLLFA